MIITELANVFFTVAIFLIAGIPVSTSDPCAKQTSEAKYNKFVHQHVLRDGFDRNSNPAWKSYLETRQLWCRYHTQSFVEESQNVEDVCSSGLRVRNSRNLCVSRSAMKVYNVVTKKDNNGCTGIDVRHERISVVVACDKVGGRCLPVHYEGNRSLQASNVPCSPERDPGFD